MERSGPFVEHAKHISKKLNKNTYLIADNNYIYTHILPGDHLSKDAYGKTTYYGAKVIFKSQDERV